MANSFLWNETLFTTVSTLMMSTEIYFEDGIRKFARRTTKVDEGDGGEERLIETSANRSYVLCSDMLRYTFLLSFNPYITHHGSIVVFSTNFRPEIRLQQIQ